MLLFREKIPADWLPKILGNLPEVLVDHAHLERKAATTALNLEKYRDLYNRVEELNALAIEELAHFYASLVEAEGNHYAIYLLMARAIDEKEADVRLDYFLNLDVELMRQPNPRPMLH